MTFFRHILKATDNLFGTKRCIIYGKNSWSGEGLFGSEVKVPSPPKRPLSAYMIFCQENRKEVLKSNPSLSVTLQIKLLAEKWNALTEEMKQPYELSARQKTQAYGEEHKKFYESLTEEQKEELTRLKAKKMESRRNLRHKKALKDSGLPKAPNSAYTLFVQAEAKKNKPSGLQASEFIKKVAESWKLLPEESKKAFEIQAEQEKRLYAEEMRGWRIKMLSDGNKKVLKAYEELKGKVLEFPENPHAPTPTPAVKKQEKSKAKN